MQSPYVRCYLAIGLTCFCLAGPGLSATFVVTRFDDGAGTCSPADCTLRAAVMAANTLPGPDRIELPMGTYFLTIPGADTESMPMPEFGDLDVLDSLEFAGPAGAMATIIGNGDDRVLEVAFTDITVSNISFSGGVDNVDIGGCVRLFASTATIRDSSISNCFSNEGGGGLGIGVSTATLINTTISGNRTNTTGGGIIHVGLPADRLELINCTVSGNVSSLPGGGIDTTQLLVLRHTTIAQNSAPFGDVLFSNGALVYNSILSGKCTGFAPTSKGGNLSGPDLSDHCLSFSVEPDDIAAADLGLAPLADNGGPTLTHGLLEGSPAIDAANAANCVATDQRGMPRPEGPACDIGSFEGSVAVAAIPAASFAGLIALMIALAGTGLVCFRLNPR